MRGIHQGLGGFALQARQADVEAGLERDKRRLSGKIHFGVDGRVGRKSDPRLAGHEPIAPSKQADQPAANSCSGLVPVPARQESRA